MKANINVFCSCMKLVVMYESNRTLIVAVKSRSVMIRESLGVWDLTKLKGTSTSTTSPENGFDGCEKPEVTGTLGNNRLGTETRERESLV